MSKVAPDADAINEYFTKIGSVLESKKQWLQLPRIHKKLQKY